MEEDERGKVRPETNKSVLTISVAPPPGQSLGLSMTLRATLMASMRLRSISLRMSLDAPRSTIVHALGSLHSVMNVKYLRKRGWNWRPSDTVVAKKWQMKKAASPRQLNTSRSSANKRGAMKPPGEFPRLFVRALNRNTYHRMLGARRWEAVSKQEV